MIVLGFDTSTAATAVALRLADGHTTVALDDPPAGAHPGHATRLLEMVHDLLVQAGVAWSEIDRIAVGIGPGTFTGLRVGVATARGLAQSLQAELVGVSSLQALATSAFAAQPNEIESVEPAAVLAVIDAKRGEAFAAAYERGDRMAASELVPAQAVAPSALADVLADAERSLGAVEREWLAVGDGAVRFRDELTRASVRVPPDDSTLHRVGGAAICELGMRLESTEIQAIEPDYRRRPDAELALEAAGTRGGSTR